MCRDRRSVKSWARMSRDSSKDSEISVMSRGKISWLSIATLKGNRERYASLVAELVQLKVDVLVASERTSSVPRSQAGDQDDSYCHRDHLGSSCDWALDSWRARAGISRGLPDFTRELSGKRLELLKEAVPSISRVGVLWDTNVGSPEPSIGFKEYEAAARALKIQLQSLEVRGPNPILRAPFKLRPRGARNALITIRNPLFDSLPKADCGPCHKVPTAVDARDK